MIVNLTVTFLFLYLDELSNKDMNKIAVPILAAFIFWLAPSTSAQEVNYDESLIPTYTLPDPLVMQSGKTIRNKRQWEKARRPELLEMFQKEMFGRMPGRPDGLHFKLVSEDPSALGGKATRKDITVYFDAGETLCMNLLMFVPNDADGPVPAFLGVNFKWNDATFGEAARRWPYEYIISHGYAVATFWRDDVDPDWHDGFKNGIHGLLDAGKERMADSWGTIAAWAWGLSRALDYLETDKDIDSRRVAVFGHSRLGKTALWAGATDERFALVISNDSGCSGAALSRRRIGEDLRTINKNFPHWFCHNYHKYSSNEDALPFDQHELVAMVAPRPVYVASASDDLWADPKGEMLSLVHASPVYALYGYETFNAEELPAVNTQVCTDRMGYHLREGKHDIILYDWQHFISFADRFLK